MTAEILKLDARGHRGRRSRLKQFSYDCRRAALRTAHDYRSAARDRSAVRRLTRYGDLSPAARIRALECLSRFGERLRDMHASSVRAAGTSALRRARDSEGFREEAENALGHPIEVISGREEARLDLHRCNSQPAAECRISTGAGHWWRQYRVDTRRRQANRKRSKVCTWAACCMTETYFREGKISRKSFDEARLAVRLKLRPVKGVLQKFSNAEAIGTSGTILATEAVARELGVIESNDLTPEVVEQLIERVLRFDHVDRISLSGLPDRRAQVWPGGLAILAELLRVLRSKHCGYRTVLCAKACSTITSAGYSTKTLAREACERWHADSMSTVINRIGWQKLRLTCLLNAQSDWQLTSSFAADILSWSAALHEIGLDISHSGFQRHGAYIVENADMPGFPRAEQKILAFLIANQRQVINLERCQASPKSWHRSALRLMILLRISVLLNRSRSTTPLPPIKLTVDENGLSSVSRGLAERQSTDRRRPG